MVDSAQEKPDDSKTPLYMVVARPYNRPAEDYRPVTPPKNASPQTQLDILSLCVPHEKAVELQLRAKVEGLEAHLVRLDCEAGAVDLGVVDTGIDLEAEADDI